MVASTPTICQPMINTVTIHSTSLSKSFNYLLTANEGFTGKTYKAEV